MKAAELQMPLTSQIINSMSDYVSILDKQANFINVNNRQIAIMGYKSDEEILGNTYFQFKGIASNTAEIFISEDQKVMNENKSLRYLSYHRYNDGEWHLLLGDKNCILDNSANVIGIFSHAKDVTNNGLIDLSRFMCCADKKYTKKINRLGFDYFISNKDKNNLFTEKEMLVIFYFLRGKTVKEIANIILRSQKTVNFHLDVIKSKCQLSTKSLLTEKLIHDGYMNFIPEEVFASH